jgi:DNA-binding protein HU-beta
MAKTKSAPKKQAAVKSKAAVAKPKAAASKIKNPRTKGEIITVIAEAAEISKAQAKTAYDTLLEIAYNGVKKAKLNEGINLPGLGTLVKIKRKARTGRNPSTGEPIKIPAKTTAKFRLAKAAKDAVL